MICEALLPNMVIIIVSGILAKGKLQQYTLVYSCILFLCTLYQLMYHLCREFPQYAPAADLSVKYCFASSKAGPSPVSQLTLFDAAHGKYNC